ncbi:hypothetical protein GCM10009720_18760 [Yaniella flava]|uniref:Glycosyltransferase 2-like domain-containing protein n=2 Tax=Yaniella flava TaxID=287930 RepID=A0ABP5G3T5_9MICC
MNYYRHKVSSNLDSFVKFAMRSRSVHVRDVLAGVSSDEYPGYADLLAAIDSFLTSQTSFSSVRLEELYNHRILLSLANLVANTARDDVDTHASLRIYDFVLQVFESDAFDSNDKMQYLEALVEGDRGDELGRLGDVFQINELAPMQSDLLDIQRIRRSAPSETSWVEAMNRFYSRLGMSKIRLTGDDKLPFLDRLESDTRVVVDGPTVSVIMPTYCPGPGIRTAVRSLLQQTWKNTEIIIVDDASPVEYRDLFLELENLGPSIRVLRQDTNSGAYVARNRGVSDATGEFITIHDDDDWSHPDKLALQMEALLGNNEIIASSSAHIRTTADLDFKRVNTQPSYLQMNYSSLMFHRSLIAEIGMWDTVNRGADGEFLLRMITRFGASRIAELAEKPLSFSRIWSGSLTSGEMSRGYFAQSRLLYREAFRKWHRETKKAGSQLILNVNEPRQFPVPTTFEAGRRNADLGTFDVIYVTDFFRQAKYPQTVLAELNAFIDAGLRVGYMQLPSPETVDPSGFSPLLFEMQLEGNLTQVSHDDVACTELLVVYGSAMGMFLDNLGSTVRSRRSILVHHELPSLGGEENRRPALLAQSLRNLDRCFDTRFRVTGATKYDYNWLKSSSPRGRLLPTHLIWHPVLSERAHEISVPEGTPTVGFHSHGNAYRWPATEAEFVEIYDSPEFHTRIFGNVNPAVKKYGGEAFKKISILKPQNYTKRQFFDDISFWVYYPHHRLSVQPWLPVLEAMRAGKVVILPKRLEPTYGDGAIYVEPEEVGATVNRLANDPRSFISQATLGQKFVADRFTNDRLLERYRRLVSSTSEA